MLQSPIRAKQCGEVLCQRVAEDREASGTLQRERVAHFHGCMSFVP